MSDRRGGHLTEVWCADILSLMSAKSSRPCIAACMACLLKHWPVWIGWVIHHRVHCWVKPPWRMHALRIGWLNIKALRIRSWDVHVMRHLTVLSRPSHRDIKLPSRVLIWMVLYWSANMWQHLYTHWRGICFTCKNHSSQQRCLTPK